MRFERISQDHESNVITIYTILQFINIYIRYEGFEPPLFYV